MSLIQDISAEEIEEAVLTFRVTDQPSGKPPSKGVQSVWADGMGKCCSR
jgi:hypothetical protein